MNVARNITKLGKILSDIDVHIDVPEIKELNIKEGKYSLQRFFYHYFMKCYWNDELSFEENAVINYDWYHPQDCTMHTIEEIEGWFKENNLRVIYSHEDFYGITMHGMVNEKN